MLVYFPKMDLTAHVCADAPLGVCTSGCFRIGIRRWAINFGLRLYPHGHAQLTKCRFTKASKLRKASFKAGEFFNYLFSFLSYVSDA